MTDEIYEITTDNDTGNIIENNTEINNETEDITENETLKSRKLKKVSKNADELIAEIEHNLSRTKKHATSKNIDKILSAAYDLLLLSEPDFVPTITRAIYISESNRYIKEDFAEFCRTNYKHPMTLKFNSLGEDSKRDFIIITEQEITDNPEKYDDLPSFDMIPKAMEFLFKNNEWKIRRENL